MSREKAKSTILKLRAHERSARTLGSRLEADAYRAQVNKLKRKYRLTERDLTEGEKAPVLASDTNEISGKWKCSCGTVISLSISAGAGSFAIGEMLLAPHRAPGHRLTKVE